MTIDLYYANVSGPCRAVLLAAKAIGIDLNLIYLDFKKREHLTPEFIQMNPQHMIPTLVDNGFVLWESRAIMAYLVSQYGKDDSLYPKDPKQRAVVDQRLHFDLGILSARYSDYYYPVYFGSGSFEPAKLERIKEAFNFLNVFLENQEFAAGNNLTIADFALIATVSNFEISGFDISPYPNVLNWCKKVKTTAPGYEEANGKNALMFKQMIEQFMKNK